MFPVTVPKRARKDTSEIVLIRNRGSSMFSMLSITGNLVSSSMR